MDKLMTLRDLSVYLGHMDVEDILALVRSGDLPMPNNGIDPERRSARWDSMAVDGALDVARDRKATRVLGPYDELRRVHRAERGRAGSAAAQPNLTVKCRHRIELFGEGGF